MSVGDKKSNAQPTEDDLIRLLRAAVREHDDVIIKGQNEKPLEGDMIGRVLLIARTLLGVAENKDLSEGRRLALRGALLLLHMAWRVDQSILSQEVPK